MRAPGLYVRARARVHVCVCVMAGGYRELMELVRTESRRMIDAQPSESAIGNMARRGTSVSVYVCLYLTVCVCLCE